VPVGICSVKPGVTEYEPIPWFVPAVIMVVGSDSELNVCEVPEVTLAVPEFVVTEPGLTEKFVTGIDLVPEQQVKWVEVADRVQPLPEPRLSATVTVPQLPVDWV
jgi:hypothetical protein